MCQLSTSLLTLKKGLLLGLFITVLNVNFAFAQNCSANLTVEKDRNVKSASIGDGASFNMVLTNTSSEAATYFITTKSLKESCATQNKMTSAPNVILNVSLKGSNKLALSNNALTLKSGETKNFKVYATLPPKTPYNTWSCIEVIATSKECDQPAASTIVRVFVPEPSDG
jgi:hypothetical protein